MEMISAAIPGVSAMLFVGGVVTGLLVGMFVLPAGREAKRLASELDKLRAEYDDYKREVTGHFQKSSELFAGMTQSYKAVYDHLAGGARELCETPETDNVLAFSGTRLIEIEEVGSTVRQRVPAEAETTDAEKAENPTSAEGEGQGDPDLGEADASDSPSPDPKTEPS